MLMDISKYFDTHIEALQTDDWDELEKKIKAAHMPKEARAKAETEL